MTPAELLRAARAKIADPKHWTQGELARDSGGRPVGPRNPGAVCWCSMGALEAISFLDAKGALRFLREAVPDDELIKSATYFNDERKHGDVMGLFDRAIQLAEAQS